MILLLFHRLSPTLNGPDALYVPADQFAMVEALPRGELSVLRSEHGHDGFLIDADRLEPILRRFRHKATEAQQQLTAA